MFTVIPDYLTDGLNPRQIDALKTLEGPLLIVAGPGSGKTKVLTHRIAALLATGRAKPWEILAVTFTNKAAVEMRERIKILVGDDDGSRIWVSTFHASCARILRSNYREAGLPSNFSILDTDDANRVLSGVLKDLELPYEKAEINEYSKKISRARNNNVAYDEVEVRGFGNSNLAEVYRKYNIRLDEIGGVDFDELLSRTAKLLKNNREIAELYRDRFKYILVDEYQDTNPVQYEITRALSAASSNICVVGDFDQSIYAWRGATPEVMSRFTTDYPDAAVVVLEQNYRSSATIVDVCSSIIAPNPSVHRPKLFTANDKGDAVRVLACLDERDEARVIVKDLLALSNNQTSAILLRTNAQSRPFEEELSANRTSYSVVGALKFYERSEIKDALSWIKIALNNQDSISLSRAAGAPKRGIGNSTLELIISYSRDNGISVLQAARDMLSNGLLPTRASRPVRSFLESIDLIYKKSAEEGPSAALRALFNDVGLIDHFRKDSENGLQRIENLEALLAGSDGYSNGEPMAETVAFIENASLVSADTNSIESQRVFIMTVHASKGKEFDWVYVTGVEADFFPLARLGEPIDMDEERRLLFVACSRARKKLTLSYAEQRMRYGKNSSSKASPFLDHLPAEVLRIETPSLIEGFNPAKIKKYSAWSLEDFSKNSIPRGVFATSVVKRYHGRRLTAAQALPGVKVKHTIFGDGVVISLHDGIDPILVVAFEDCTRSLSLNVAPLEIIK